MNIFHAWWMAKSAGKPAGFLIRRLGADEELRATWTRYHLVRDCLRHQDGGIAEEDLCARVSQALANE